MEATAIQTIVSALIMYINAAMYISDSQVVPPQIWFVPQSQMQVKACENKPCGVQGWYDNDNQSVYLLDTLNIRDDMHARSILLHELVHYVQDKKNMPRLANDCLTWKAREVQAYNIQYNWLYDNRVRVKTPTYNIALVGFESLQCPSE